MSITLKEENSGKVLEAQISGKLVHDDYKRLSPEFEKLLKAMNPPAELIYRRMFFVHGVPKEYSNLVMVPDFEKVSGLFLQGILPEEWACILAQESASGTDSIMLASKPQPRPEGYGPCPCPECKREREEGLQSRYA